MVYLFQSEDQDCKSTLEGVFWLMVNPELRYSLQIVISLFLPFKNKLLGHITVRELVCFLKIGN